MKAFRDGRAADVPLVIGANSNEASVLATLGVPTAALAPPSARAWRSSAGSTATRLRCGVHAPGDGRCRVRRALALGRRRDRVRRAELALLLQLRRRGPPRALPGANHGSEIPYVFKTWTRMPLLARAMTADDKAMSTMMSACWVSFAKTGRPACPPAPEWPAYDPKTDRQM